MSLVLQSFRHYAKAHLGLLGGAFLTSAILSGSLLVGDSVRASLRHAAEQRLGQVRAGLVGGDRWFTEDLARQTDAVPVILMNGSVSESTGRARVNAVQVLGVDVGFWKLAPDGGQSFTPLNPEGGTDTVAVNESLARRLGVKAGDTILLRLEAPSAISRDAPLSGNTNEEVTMRRTISRIVDAEGFGAFQLTASQTGTDTVFVALHDLQEAVEKKGRVNLLLSAQSLDPARLTAAATLEDFALKLARLPAPQNEWQLTTERVFLDDSLAHKLLKAQPGSHGVLTYLINGLSSPKSKERTPYSMVTATDSGDAMKDDEATITQWLADDLSLAPGDTFDIRFFTVGLGRELKEQTATFTVRDILPMNDPRVNRDWTPEFPGVSDVDNCRDWQPGIPVKLDAIRDKDEKYWDDFRGTPKAFISLAAGKKLWGNRFGNLTSIRFPGSASDEAEFRRDLVSQLSLADIGLVPRDFRAEGSAAAKGSVDFGGLFIGLSLFLIAAALVFSALLFLFTLEKRAPQVGLLLAIGWTPKQVRRSVLAEAGLVALVGSALGLLGGFAYTQLALTGLNGIWSGATAGMKLLFHGSPGTLAIAFFASVLAALATLWWASRRMFRASAKDLLVGEAWSAAGAAQQLSRAAKPSKDGAGTSGDGAKPPGGSAGSFGSSAKSLGEGAGSPGGAPGLSGGTTGSFREGAKPSGGSAESFGEAAESFGGSAESFGEGAEPSKSVQNEGGRVRIGSNRGAWGLSAACFLAALGLAFVGGRATNPQAVAGMFFGAGFLLLAAGLILVRGWLRSLSSGLKRHASSLRDIGLRNVTRRPGRSLAVIGMMAGGIFLVIAVNAFRLSGDADPMKRDSGTGGFALIGESSLPIYEDLNAEAAWDAFALDEKIMARAKVVPFRVREGDDASCLNLNRAQTPVLCAVNPKAMGDWTVSSEVDDSRFKFVAGTWSELAGSPAGGIPAIADQATAMWGLGKGVGDTLTYTGADGKPFTVRIAGLLSGSVLQGKVIVDEAAFLQKFPDTAGYKFFLIDAKPADAPEVSGHLTKQLQTRGLALEPAADRLAAFLAVQNTYIGIFTILGGLGVLLGTAGLGVLAARNILERKGEFGLMQALGFLPGALRRMVLSEHSALLAAGLILGLVSAALAVWPNVQQSGGDLPLGFLLWLNVGILAFGISVCWLAARLALSGKLLEAVRRE